MTRRARMGALQTLGRGVDRMAPGGRRSAAESPIRPFYRPVGEAGGEPVVEVQCINPATQFAWTGEWTSGVADPPKYSYYVYSYNYPNIPDPPLCCGIPPYGWNPPPPPPAGTTQVTLTITPDVDIFAGSSFVISCKPGHSQTVSGGPWAAGVPFDVVIPADWEFLRFPESDSAHPAWPKGGLLLCPAPESSTTTEVVSDGDVG